MNIKQATAMLNQIKESGLQNKSKVAQELVQELELLIKSAGLKKRADLKLYIGAGDLLKNLYAYWATAALLKLQEQGEVKLQGIDIPVPNIGETANQFGTRVMSALKVRGRRPGRRRASAQAYAKIVSTLFESQKGLIEKGIKDAYKYYMINHRERYDVGSTLEDVWQVATDWATTHLIDPIERVEGARAMNVQAYAWNRIQKATKTSSDIGTSVFKAIKVGVFNVLPQESRFFNMNQRLQFGVIEDDESLTTPVSLSVGEGEETYDRPELSRKILDDYSKLQFDAMSDEQLESLKKTLIKGGFDNKQEVKLELLIELVKNGNLKSGDSYFESVYDDFVADNFDSDLKDGFRDLLVEVGELTISTAEGLDLLSRFEAGEFDSDIQLKEEMKEDLIENGWYINNVEPNVEAEEAADMIVERAEERAELAVSSMNIPGDGKLQEAVSENIKLELEIEELKRLSKMFEDDQFHWMIDSNLYLQDTEWAYATRYFDPEAMSLLQQTINEHKEPLIAVGLRYLLNASTFTDKAKVVAIKEFADSCMDVSRIFSGKDAGVYSWYLECAIKLNGGLTFKVAGKDTTVKVDTLSYFTPTKTAMIYELTKRMTQDEREALGKKIDALMKPYFPSGDKQLTGTEWVAKLYGQKDKKQAVKVVGKGARGGKKLKAFFSIIASELVRYRFYLDLNLTDPTGPTVPKNLGNAECDNRVLALMPPIPTSAVNEVKSVIYDDHILPRWREEVKEALQAREEVKINKKQTFNALAKDLFNKLEITEDTELYQAFMGIK